MGIFGHAKPDYSKLQGVRAYKPYRPEPEQNPPQSVSGIFPYTEQQVRAEALLAWVNELRAKVGLQPLPLVEEEPPNDGIALCGYDAL